MAHHRTVTEIQMTVIKQGKRNALSRVLHAKGERDRIAAWWKELSRLFSVFNVSSINVSWNLRT